MLLSMAVDLDHLLANPVFDPERCSIGFHYLSPWPAIIVYFSMIFFKNLYVRILGVGLLFHMFTDFIDCLWLFTKCSNCCAQSALQWLCGWGVF